MNPATFPVSGVGFSNVPAPSSAQIFQAPAALPGMEEALARLEALLSECKRQNASDVHLTGGTPPYFRINNQLAAVGSAFLSPEDVERMALSLMTESQRRVYEERRQIDLAFYTSDRTRFRVNIFHQRGTTALALRRLDDEFRDFHQLNLPPQLMELGEFPYGLVIVTGPTGSGKSTTLATLIHQINTTRSHHIITIEDPIEHVHRNMKSLIRQRELHVDVPDFASALKAALREDPDVLLVGEMRDLETMRAAVTAAETGHLVFSTLHTGDVVGSVGRMVGAFPADEQPMVRDQLSRVLRAVVSQRLLRRKDGKGRVPVVEIMRVNVAIANLIRLGDMRQAYSIIQSGGEEGMLPMEQALAILTATGLIAREEAISWARDPGVYESRLRNLQPRGR